MNKINPKIVILKLLLLSIFTTHLISCKVEFDIELDDFIAPVEYIPANIKSEKEGLLGQRILITGENFLLDSLSFSFNEKLAYAYYKNKDSLMVTVPRELDKIESIFRIFLGRKDSLIYSSTFRLKKPKLESFSKDKVTFGEDFWVYGENFDNNNDYIDAFINDEKIGNYDFNYESFKVTVPNNIQQKKLSIKVNARLQEDYKKDALELQEPIINSFPSKVFIGTNQNILKGKYFNPETKYSKVLINDIIETVIYHTNDSENIDIIVPYGPYKDFKIHSISYETAGMKVEKNVDIEIVSNHILYTKSYPISNIRNQFVFNDEFYVISIKKDFTQSPPIYYLWKFNSETQEWEKKEEIKIPAYGLMMSEIKNGILYLYRDSKIDGLLKLDMNTLTVENITNIPDRNVRNSPAFFVYKNNLYLGKGSTFNGDNTNNSKRELYKCDLSSSTMNWEKVNIDETLIYQSKAFLDNGEMYISSVINGSNANYSLYKFNETNSSFEIVNDYGIDTQYYIKINNKNFRINYNRVTNIKRVYPFDVKFNEIFSFRLDGLLDENDSSYFAHNNEVYFIGYVRNGTYYNTLGMYKLSNEINQQFK